MVATYGIGILEWPGLPGPSYELAFCLAVLSDRVNTRRSFVVLDGVRGALEPAIGQHFFRALMEDEEQADFYAGLHQSRVDFQLRAAKRGRDLGDFLGEAGQ